MRTKNVPAGTSCSCGRGRRCQSEGAGVGGDGYVDGPNADSPRLPGA